MRDKLKMKTIRSILEKVMNYGANEFIQSPKRPQLTIDQALSEIEEIIQQKVIEAQEEVLDTVRLKMDTYNWGDECGLRYSLFKLIDNKKGDSHEQR